MSHSSQVQAKYIWLDTVKYSKRSVDAQLEIRRVLDQLVKASIREHKVPQNKEHLIYIPTGDGMCIALLDIPSFDIHLRIALSILRRVEEYSDNVKDRELRFALRIGIHAQTDHRVIDINRNRNLAGAGINLASRIMNLADGGQILVSQYVFNELSSSKKYERRFIRFNAKVRHNKSVIVYQFKGDDNGLNSEPPSTIKAQKEAQHLARTVIDPATALGLKAIYKCRDQKVGNDVRKAIDNARDTVWLLGVGLYTKLNIADHKVIRMLDNKINDGVNVRILLLDGFRSPAVFRALLESSCEEAESIAKTERRTPLINDPYFENQLYSNFETAYRKLAGVRNFKAAVRFYGQAPGCWLAIIDDQAYFQPYTLGDISDNPASHLIGSQMPVIKLQGRTAPFNLLEDHFNKVWLTSDTDLFHTGARIIARDKTLWKTFVKRRESKWFEHIYGVLCNKKDPGHDQRTHPRQPCISLRLDAFVKWDDGETSQGKIVDFSLNGVFLELEFALDRFTSLPEDYTLLEKDIIVELEIEPEGGWKAKRRGKKPRGISDKDAAQHLINNLLKPSNHFRYIWKKLSEAGKPRFGFQALK